MPRPALLRWLVPALLILGWLGIGAVAGPMAAKVSEVQKNDNASFLPANAESTKALELDKAFTGSETVPAIVVWERSSGLTAADRAAIDAAARKIGDIDGLSGPPSPSSCRRTARPPSWWCPFRVRTASTAPARSSRRSGSRRPRSPPGCRRT